MKRDEEGLTGRTSNMRFNRSHKQSQDASGCKASVTIQQESSDQGSKNEWPELRQDMGDLLKPGNLERSGPTMLVLNDQMEGSSVHSYNDSLRDQKFSVLEDWEHTTAAEFSSKLGTGGLVSDDQETTCSCTSLEMEDETLSLVAALSMDHRRTTLPDESTSASQLSDANSLPYDHEDLSFTENIYFVAHENEQSNKEQVTDSPKEIKSSEKQFEIDMGFMNFKDLFLHTVLENVVAEGFRSNVKSAHASENACISNGDNEFYVATSSIGFKIQADGLPYTRPTMFIHDSDSKGIDSVQKNWYSEYGYNDADSTKQKNNEIVSYDPKQLCLNISADINSLEDLRLSSLHKDFCSSTSQSLTISFLETDIEQNEVKENQPKVTAENQPKETAENQPKVRAENEIKVTAENQPKVRAENQTKVRAENQPKVTAENQTKVRAENQPKVTAENQPKVRAENQPKVTAENQTKVTAENQTKVTAENQPKVTAENQTKVTAENQTKVTAENHHEITAEYQHKVAAKKKHRVVVRNQPTVTAENQHNVTPENQYKVTVKNKHNNVSVENQPKATVENQPKGTVENQPRGTVENQPKIKVENQSTASQDNQSEGQQTDTLIPTVEYHSIVAVESQRKSVKENHRVVNQENQFTAHKHHQMKTFEETQPYYRDHSCRTDLTPGIDPITSREILGSGNFKLASVVFGEDNSSVNAIRSDESFSESLQHDGLKDSDDVKEDISLHLGFNGRDVCEMIAASNGLPVTLKCVDMLKMCNGFAIPISTLNEENAIINECISNAVKGETNTEQHFSLIGSRHDVQCMSLNDLTSKNAEDKWSDSANRELSETRYEQFALLSDRPETGTIFSKRSHNCNSQFTSSQSEIAAVINETAQSPSENSKTKDGASILENHSLENKTELQPTFQHLDKFHNIHDNRIIYFDDCAKCHTSFTNVKSILPVSKVKSFARKLGDTTTHNSRRLERAYSEYQASTVEAKLAVIGNKFADTRKRASVISQLRPGNLRSTDESKTYPFSVFSQTSQASVQSASIHCRSSELKSITDKTRKFNTTVPNNLSKDTFIAASKRILSKFSVNDKLETLKDRSTGSGSTNSLSRPNLNIVPATTRNYAPMKVLSRCQSSGIDRVSRMIDTDVIANPKLSPILSKRGHPVTGGTLSASHGVIEDHDTLPFGQIGRTTLDQTRIINISPAVKNYAGLNFTSNFRSPHEEEQDETAQTTSDNDASTFIGLPSIVTPSSVGTLLPKFSPPIDLIHVKEPCCKEGIHSCISSFFRARFAKPVSQTPESSVDASTQEVKLHSLPVGSSGHGYVSYNREEKSSCVDAPYTRTVQDVEDSSSACRKTLELRNKEIDQEFKCDKSSESVLSHSTYTMSTYDLDHSTEQLNNPILNDRDVEEIEEEQSQFPMPNGRDIFLAGLQEHSTHDAKASSNKIFMNDLTPSYDFSDIVEHFKYNSFLNKLLDKPEVGSYFEYGSRSRTDSSNEKGKNVKKSDKNVHKIAHVPDMRGFKPSRVSTSRKTDDSNLLPPINFKRRGVKNALHEKKGLKNTSDYPLTMDEFDSLPPWETYQRAQKVNSLIQPCQCLCIGEDFGYQRGVVNMSVVKKPYQKADSDYASGYDPRIESGERDVRMGFQPSSSMKKRNTLSRGRKEKSTLKSKTCTLERQCCFTDRIELSTEPAVGVVDLAKGKMCCGRRTYEVVNAKRSRVEILENICKDATTNDTNMPYRSPQCIYKRFSEATDLKRNRASLGTRQLEVPFCPTSRMLSNGYFNPANNVISIVVKPVNLSPNNTSLNVMVKIYRNPEILPRFNALTKQMKKKKVKKKPDVIPQLPLSRNIIEIRAANPPFNTTMTVEADIRFKRMYANQRIL